VGPVNAKRGYNHIMKEEGREEHEEIDDPDNVSTNMGTCIPLLVSLPPQPYSSRRKIRVVEGPGSEAEELERYKCLLFKALSRENDFKARVKEGDQRFSTLEKTLDKFRGIQASHIQ